MTAIHTQTLNWDPRHLIDWFDNFNGPHPFDFLSNFHEGHPVEWAGFVFPTTEHAFAWEKVDLSHPDAVSWLGLIRESEGPAAAKVLGRACPLQPEWEARKFQVMRDIVWQKFTQHPDLAELLDATGTAYLQEGTYWDDRVWGVDLTSHDDPAQREGLNWLGLILMDTRARLRLGGGGR